MASAVPRLVVTLGDPAGIGPEVVLKALAEPPLTQQAAITVMGMRSHLVATYDALIQSGLPPSQLADPQTLTILEPPHIARTDLPLGQGTAASGEVSFQSLRSAIAHTQAGDFEAIVTAPIAKSAWKQAGHVFPGQTELLAETAGVERYGMLFVARSPHSQWQLRTLLATTHIPLSAVPQQLSAELMDRKLGLLIDCLRYEFGIAQPRIAIAGLNPHSGEQGQLGDDEQTWLIPWLQAARQTYPQATLEGPIPPDTLWVKPGQAWFGVAPDSSTAHDAYLALYHDQGLIPVKLMAFDRAVNTTIGLPFVRTSPDHGTAFDIAGQGVASATSMIAAIELAAELARRRYGAVVTEI